ncbi:CRISPR-associated Csa2 family autoregulator [Spirosoma oryzae]|uniref:CRISPR-associated Csa2 family autoregulator n=1 Tax=Spirosoma oryzae TaxID=1469603 RepID=A0A2T0T2P5_9BACT|nr:DevR family CRISPR-associated autoregulator [Spirosoma oryzae]PRY39958.1 CRISPR-associated Csa2 family autoregulator [Spirosoma oryzae]
MTSQTISSIAISGEITLNLHSLNNEGGEGNQIVTRQLTIVDKNGEEHTVNGISGDMFKHIHAGHLVNLAKEKSEQLPLCRNCQEFNANRLSDGRELGERFKTPKETKDREVVDAIIDTCVIDDLHGVLITSIGSTNKNVPRKSVMEFAWTVGIPGKTNTESYLHAKFVPDPTDVRGEAGNSGQNLFHRPANHGVYAFVCSLDAYRIGYNDITRKYVEADSVDRQERYKAAVQSLISTFLNPRGAMTSSQKPHITDFKGVVSVSSRSLPAPTISPLNDDYREQIDKISQELNKLEPDAIRTMRFENLGELAEILVEIAGYEPYELG